MGLVGIRVVPVVVVNAGFKGKTIGGQGKKDRKRFDRESKSIITTRR
jgi:hypothetical protein